MNSRQLEYFLAVARELNFTKAAESMYVSQTAVTQQIKALENQLGVQLFERTKRKVTLTAAGRVFRDEAIAIINRMDRAVDRTRKVTSGFIGTLNIGFTVGLGNTNVAERIHAFHRSYPNISMQFVNQGSTRLIRLLKEGHLDVAMLPLFNEKYYEDFCYSQVARDRLMAFMPRDHVLAQNQYVTWRELKDEPIIVPAEKENEIGEDRIIIDNFIRRGYQPRIEGYIEDIEVVKFMVSSHMGITVLPEYLAIPEVSKEWITAVPFGAWEDQMIIVAVWLPGSDNPSLEKIIPFLQERQAEDINEEGF